ncbi:MAG TPA: NAD(P)/FAD-dependent oxidoreductase [Spirochaetia bacterium]|nr:NAD(P)/FAD-dependent oxidoreductase [Spirochaetia bacterium]
MGNDLLVVGGGPAGLYAAFYAGLRNLSVRLLEADHELGGRLRYYPEKLVWDLGGLPPTPGARIRDQLEAQARTFDADLRCGRRVVWASREGPGWVIEDHRGEEHFGRAIILALGAGILGVRRLEVPGASAAEGNGLEYSLGRVEDYRGRTVVISGGGNSSVDWAHQLAPVARKVTLVHRRREFRAHERVVADLGAAGVEVLAPWKLTRIGGDSTVAWVDLEPAEGGPPVTRAADAVLVGHGVDFEADTTLGALAGRPGVFLAGDCRRREGKAYLMASTFPDAAEAVNAAHRFLDPTTEAQAMVSSHHERLRTRAPGGTPNSF